MHLLVAAYLGFEAPSEVVRSTRSDAPNEGPVMPSQTPWMAGMGAIPASDDLRTAGTPLEALAALERTFFGTVTP